jgi:iron complex outermembrane receptor protein
MALAGAALNLLIAAPAAAQDQSEPTADAEVLPDEKVILVTATKRSQNAQDVPISITALDAETVLAAGINDAEELRVAVPALNVTRGAGGFALPRIRGVGATGQGNGIENPVAVYVDDVYYLASSGLLSSLFDAEQVTVLKGPQGTLFGRNSTGGLIQIKTLDPELGRAKGKGQIGYGNYDTFNAAGFVSVPVSDSVAFSLSGQYENRADGFGVNRFTGNDVRNERQYAARGKILFEPSSDTRILLSADINGTRDNGPAFVPFSKNTQGVIITDLIESLGGDPRYDIYSDVDPKLDGEQWGLSLNIEQTIGSVTFKSVTAYRETDLSTFFDPDGIPLPTLRILNVNYDRTFTQELDLLSDDAGPFKWAIGGFYVWNSAGQDPGRTTGTTQFGDNGFNDVIPNVKLNSYSGFAWGSYAVSPATTITGGLRYTSDERVLNVTSIGFNGATNTTTTSVLPEQSVSFDDWSWKLSLDHRFSDAVLAYVSYNRGFRAGTFVPQASPIIVLEPEQLDAFEVGLKTNLFDNRVQFNVAGYYYDQSSVQVIQVIAGVQNVYSARGGAEIYGLDADLIFQVTDNFRLFGGVAFNHARYNEFTDAIISVPFPLSESLGAAAATFSTTQFTYIDSQTGATIANTACLGTFVPPGPGATQAGRDAFYRNRLGGNCLLRGDASGNRLQNTPDWTGSLGAVLDIPTDTFGTFSLTGNLYYNGGFVGTPDERVAQSAFTLINTSLTWRNPKDNLFIRAWANNLTNEFYRTQISATNSSDNGTSGDPRTYGVTIGFEF